MKLKSVSVDSFGISRQLRIDNFDNGLNLIFGRTGAGKSTLARYIRNVLYGFSSQDVCQGGMIEVDENGHRSRLVRSLETANRLQSDNPSVAGRPLVEASVFDQLFFVDGRNAHLSANSIAKTLNHEFHVPLGPVALGDQRQFREAQQFISELQSRLESVSHQINVLENERNQLVHKIDLEESVYQRRRSELDGNSRALDSRIAAIDLLTLQTQIESIDREIADLRLSIDSSTDQVEYVSRPYKASDGLAILYRRLDELENQIRRWRAVHVDVQQQRVRLKDEMSSWNDMTMDSTSHPYHRSREIINDIESKIVAAEKTVCDFRTRRLNDGQQAVSMADQVSGLCAKIRTDLYSLCDELGTQYKSVRHRSAAAELKRLRRCYHEIGDNIDSLVEHRSSVVEEIRQLDPAGANAIARAENQFCQCAQHEGYLQARRQFVGELETQVHPVEFIRNDLTSEKTRLNELERRRGALVRELVGRENELSDLKAQRKSLTLEQDRGNSITDLTAIRSKLERTQFDLNSLVEDRRNIQLELDRNQQIQPHPADPILESAARFIQRLTVSEIRRVWLDDSSINTNVVVENRFGESSQFDQLSSGLQQQVILGLCLAAVEQCSSTGRQQLVILDDVFVNLDSELIAATFETLTDVGQRGQQIIALTSDPTVMNLANDRHVRRFELPNLDLPDTTINPVVPLWTPDRSSPSPVREFESFAPSLQTSCEPTINRGPELNIQRHDSLASGPTSRPEPLEQSPISESSDLSLLRIDRNNVQVLNVAGIRKISELLEIDPSNMPETLVKNRLSERDLDHWQSMAWLLLCVPSLEIEDAEILVALGINEPEQLESTHGQQLLDRISRFLNSNDGRRQFTNSRSYNRDTINRWYDSLGRTRSRWRMPSGYSRRNRWRSSTNRSQGERTRRERLGFGRQHDSQRPRSRRRDHQDYYSDRGERSIVQNHLRSSEPQQRSVSPAESKTKSEPVETVKLKFYLDKSDQLEAAPSIGPKTAERFAKIGVQTVGEFLTQTAESMSPKINYKRITAEVIRQWQNQARLVCRIPNLRGHDSQLLVACGITEPEDLAAQSPEKLFGIIQPFSESKEGLKIIRGGKQPDQDEINDWITWAQQTRSLQAA